MRRAGDADEMAGVTCFLASDDRRLHHRPDDLRRRRPDAVPELPRRRGRRSERADAAAGGRRPSAPTTSSACSTTSTTPSAARRWRSSARAGCTTSGACSTRRSRSSPGATSARRSSPPPTTRTASGVGDEPRQLDHRAWCRRRAARHAPRRAQPPADRRPRLQRLDASPSSPATAGVRRLGVETVPQIVTRGWLVDVSGRGSGAGDVIGARRRSPASTRARRRGAVPHRLGRALGRPRAPTSRASPGPGCAVADWLAERGVALTGCDTWSYGPVPAEDPERPFEVPQILNVRPRRLHRREPRHCRRSPPTACASSP